MIDLTLATVRGYVKEQLTKEDDADMMQRTSIPTYHSL